MSRGTPTTPQTATSYSAGLLCSRDSHSSLAGELDGIQARYFPGLPPVEFHASHIRAGKGFWRGVERDVKDAVLRDLGDVIARAYQGFALFAAVVEKTETLYGEEAVRRATEEVCRAFDIFLMRRYKEANDPQRGLLVLAEGRFHQRSRTWVQGFRELGTRWGILRNLCDIPYFASSRETRMLQLADYVSHATFLLYEDRNASLIRPFLHRLTQRKAHYTDSSTLQQPVECATVPGVTLGESPGTTVRGLNQDPKDRHRKPPNFLNSQTDPLPSAG